MIKDVLKLSCLLYMLHAGALFAALSQASLHITVENGLSQNDVNCLFQDRFGAIWIGTSGGVSVYNGYTIKNYYAVPDEPGALIWNNIYAIGEDGNGDLWLVTQNGLSRYDRNSDTFDNFDKSNTEFGHDYTDDLAVDSHGNMWFSSANSIFGYMASKRQFHVVRMDSLSALHGTYFKIYSGISIDSRDNIWMGTQSHGILHYSPATGISQRLYTGMPGALHLLSDSITKVFCDSRDRLWISYKNKGISLFDINTAQTKHYGISPVISIYEDRQGRIYLGTDGNGCYIYNGGKFQHLSPQNSGLYNAKVTAVMQDSQGSAWIGYRHGGLSFFEEHPNKITTIRYDKGLLPHNLINAIAGDSKGNIWMSNDKGGLLRYMPSGELEKADAYTGTGGKTAISIYVSSGDTVWVGSYGSGLAAYKHGTGIVRAYKHNPADSLSLAGNDVRSIDADSAGNLWLAIHGKGFAMLGAARDSFRNYSFQDTSQLILNGEWSHAIKCQGSYVWVASTIGLYRYDQSSRQGVFFRNWTGADGEISSNVVTSLLVDSKNRLWAGTQLGLNMLEPGSSHFRVFRQHHGLADDGINSILEDNDGAIWAGTGKGLSKISANLDSIVSYNVSDGLQGNEFARNGSYAAPGGMLYFGGMNGFSAFMPSGLKINRQPPMVLISDIKLFNSSLLPSLPNSPLSSPIYQTRELELKHDQNMISLEFIAVNYIQSGKNQFAYMMQGIDSEWIYTGTERKVNYASLSPGRYVFRVKASNNNGVWNQEGASLTIIIKPPFWMTWYAYIAYAAALIFLLHIFRKFSVISITRKNELVLEHIRKQKAEEIHQAKLQFFTDISHEIRGPLTLIIDPVNRILSHWQGDEKTRQQLGLVQKNSARMLHLINQLLDFRKVETGNEKLRCAEGDIGKFIEELCANYAAACESKDISIKQEGLDAGIYCFFDKDKVYKIVSNLLSNAVKYTPKGGVIWLSCGHLSERTKKFPEGCVYIKVADSGTGLPKGKIKAAFERFRQLGTAAEAAAGYGIGLALAKQLAELHKGELTDCEWHGTGAAFKLTLPAGMQHLTKNDMEQPAGTPSPVGEAGIDKTDINIAGHIKPGTDYVIMVVEDDAEMLKYLAGSLMGDYQIVTAQTGKAGLELANSIIPDIIVSDVRMPEMDGNEMTSHLKNNQATSHIPILMLTAGDLEQQQKESLQAGANDYLVKPIDTENLKTKIANMLRIIEMQRAHVKKTFMQQTQLPENQMSAEYIFLDKVKKSIEKQLRNSNITVHDLAIELGLSRSQLFRKFKAVLNINPKDFIQATRLNHAKKMLASPDLSIKEIAYETGFSDSRYFSRCFMKEFGLSPTDFRKSAAGHELNK
jgi:signal transduction histidine kinase/ligand-binding sensor domain-containing protein/DNA-binding response OmpR family regulator